MSRCGLLLVVLHNEDLEECLSYTIELARIIQKALSILIIYNSRKVMERFEDYMVATTFAEVEELMTVRELITDDFRKKGINYQDRLKRIKERCNLAGVELLGVNTSSESIVGAIKNLLKGDSSIEMVLLSPSIIQEGCISIRELQRLVKNISRPIVTIARNVKEKTA